MPFIYCAFSPELDRRYRRSEGASVLKFGSTLDLENRREGMKLGWLQSDGRRGPSLALVDDWDYVAIRPGDRDDEQVLLRLLGRHRLRSRSRIERSMKKAALRGLAGQTNGVGELRRVTAAVLTGLSGRRIASDTAFLIRAAAEFVRDLEMGHGAA